MFTAEEFTEERKKVYAAALRKEAAGYAARKLSGETVGSEESLKDAALAEGRLAQVHAELDRLGEPHEDPDAAGDGSDQATDDDDDEKPSGSRRRRS